MANPNKPDILTSIGIIFVSIAIVLIGLNYFNSKYGGVLSYFEKTTAYYANKEKSIKDPSLRGRLREEKVDSPLSANYKTTVTTKKTITKVEDGLTNRDREELNNLINEIE